MVAGQAIGPPESSRLVRVRHFLLALADRDEAAASAELSATPTYHVPGSNPFAGTFTGRHDIVAHFQQVFELASGSEALKWVDWMVGIDLVSALVQTRLQSGLLEFEGQLLFVFSFSPSVWIGEIWLFLTRRASINSSLSSPRGELIDESPSFLQRPAEGHANPALAGCAGGTGDRRMGENLQSTRKDHRARSQLEDSLEVRDDIVAPSKGTRQGIASRYVVGRHCRKFVGSSRFVAVGKSQ